MSEPTRTPDAATRHGFVIGAYKPLSRWAVVPVAHHSPGIPYYRKASALAFLDEVRAGLPWDRAVLLRKRWFRRVEVCDV